LTRFNIGNERAPNRRQQHQGLLSVILYNEYIESYILQLTHVDEMNKDFFLPWGGLNRNRRRYDAGNHRKQDRIADEKTALTRLIHKGIYCNRQLRAISSHARFMGFGGDLMGSGLHIIQLQLFLNLLQGLAKKIVHYCFISHPTPPRHDQTL